MNVIVFRRVLPDVLPAFLALVPESQQPGFLDQLGQLLRLSDDTEIEPWLPDLFDGDNEAVARAGALLREAEAGERAPILLDRHRPVRGARHVNTCFTGAQDDRPLPPTTCLEAGRRYRLRVGIGPLSLESIVENPVPFPVEHLPPTRRGHWLALDINSQSFLFDSRERLFFLPDRGAGWLCQCEPGTDHICLVEERSPYLYFDVATPAREGRADLRMTVTYRGALIQSQSVTADIRETERSGAGTRALIDYTLAGPLDQVGIFPPRDMNITTEQGGYDSHLLTIGGLGSERVSFHLTEGKMKNATDAARRALRDLQEERLSLWRLRSRPGDQHRLAADLARLAPLGRQLFFGLLADQPKHREALKQRMRAPLTIQVARAGRTAFVFPWALVYDINLETGNPGAHYTCPIVDELSSPAPPRCPYERDHGLNTLCPYGFWGIRHAIEQPPSIEGERSIALRVGGARPSIMAIGVGSGLDGPLTEQHLDQLAGLRPSIEAVAHKEKEALVNALAQSDLPLIYFYCHGRRQRLPGAIDPVPYLEFGRDERLTPDDVMSLNDGKWGTDHWAATSPLVFINSCYSVEITPGALTQFVDAFTGVYAAGVIGVETAVRQSLASAERPWLATEYVPGFTLEVHVSRSGRLTGDGLYGLAAGLAEALTAIQAAEVVHRDLKPSNIILAPQGPRVVDFGIARALDETAMTRTGIVLGSPGWISPEEYRGEGAGPAADVYGWGLVVTDAATGTPPFGKGRPEVVAARVLGQTMETEAIPEPLRALVNRALAKHPGERPTGGEILAAVLKLWRRDEADQDVEDTTTLLTRTWIVPVRAPFPLPCAQEGADERVGVPRRTAGADDASPCPHIRSRVTRAAPGFCS